MFQFRPLAKPSVVAILIVPILLLFHLASAASTREEPPSQAAEGLSGASWVIDGQLDEKHWKEAPRIQLAPAEEGAPEEMGGFIQLFVWGDRLCLGARLPEPDGKYQARSIGYNPVWERYALTSPPVEDRILFRIAQRPPAETGTLEITVNPWGAIRVEQEGSPLPESGILRAARPGARSWKVELSIPESLLGETGTFEQVAIEATRIRSRRPQAPEFRWHTSSPSLLDSGLINRTNQLAAPSFAPPDWGGPRAELVVGKVRKVPPLDLDWDSPYWHEILGIELLRNEPNPRPARRPAEVKWIHDGAVLQVYFRMQEEGRLDVEVDGHDGNVGSDDHLAVYLATSGSASVEILANPVGAIRDAISRGPHGYGASASALDLEIEGRFLKRRGEWMARLNLPLAEIAAALGETGIPGTWRVLLARVRQARPGSPAETCSFPVIESSFLNAPARFSHMTLSAEPPGSTPPVSPLNEDEPVTGLARDLQTLPRNALSAVERRYRDIPNMLQRWIDRRTESLAMEEHSEWDQVESLEDWEKYRDQRMTVLTEALGAIPGKLRDLAFRTTSVFRGDGYQIRNILYRSRPGFYVAANLYLPARPASKMPAIIILPAHHYPKSHGEMKDSGIVWARSGAAVLVMEHIGFGERLETSPLYRQAYESEYLLSMQLETIGESLEGWVVNDVMRTVDLFEQMGNIDMDRVILIGSVTWGGGRQAAPAGLLDQRIDAEIIYNFGRVYWYGWGIRNMIRNRITPWFVVNAFAPRKLVYAHEFWYEGEEGPEYPSVWVPAWPRYEKIYRLYGAEDDLANAQGEGLLRAGPTEFVPAGDCYMLGPVQRESLYPILKRWFDMPYPSEADRNIQKDSGLGDARRDPEYPLIRHLESQRRPPDEAVLSIPPSALSEIDRRPLHEIAEDMAVRSLGQGRAGYVSLSPEEHTRRLANDLATILGDIEPPDSPPTKLLWERALPGATVEALMMESEPGIIVPFFLIKPGNSSGDGQPVVVAVAEGGKSRFLLQRADEIQQLLAAGFAVCIPDVRGTGETAPSQYNRSYGSALSFMELGETLTGARLKDLRGVLAYLQQRSDLSPQRISLWGDSFAPVNERPIWVDELKGKPVSPQIQHFADPLGAHLALLAALYHPEIHSVAVRGGLVSYMSLLQSNFLYVPPDMTVPGILQVADLPDVLGSLSSPVLMLGPVTGTNHRADQSEIDQVYGREPGRLGKEITVRAGLGEFRESNQLIQWLIEKHDTEGRGR